MISQFAATNKALANKLTLEHVASLASLDMGRAIFDDQNEHLQLHLLLDNQPHILAFDLSAGEIGKRAKQVSKSNEVIAKAIGVKPHYRPNVLDATAGMGRDALMMAMLGCQVTLYERNFAIACLLEDALVQLKASEHFGKEVSSRLELIKMDSLSLENIDPKFEVIYLDPMFPERKKSALVKKEMRLFKRLVGEDMDADQLLTMALDSPCRRIVVKRPKGAPLLAEKKPSHQITAKKFRYDVYLKLN